MLGELQLQNNFRMDNGYFDEKLLEAIESQGCRYMIKGKAYPIILAWITDPDLIYKQMIKAGKPLY